MEGFMDTSLLKYLAFIKTVEYGSFTKAAGILNYSQSAVSRMISDLESEWKVTLLERNRAGIHLTSDGEKLLPYARKLCADYTSLQDQINSLNGLQSGLIRIGTFSSVATHWLPPVLKKFEASYPNIDYELLLGDYTEIDAWIREGRVDFGFLPLPTSSDFETIPVGRDRLLAVLPLDHPLAKEDRFPVEKLGDYPFLLLEKGAKAEISKIFEDNHLIPQVKFTTWDDYAIMSMVEAGLGISILPELILRRIPYRVAVKELSVPAYRQIGLALKEMKAASLAVRTFIEYFTSEMKSFS
jgi:DNA-binding transcriptional LysR family regulator